VCKMKKLSFVLLLLVMTCFSVIEPVQAKDKHVSDGLEGEDCTDGFESPTNTKEDGDTAVEMTEMKTGTLILTIFKMVIALLLVLGLIYLLLLFIKKKNNLFHKVGVMENIGGLSVGSQKSIQIIRIGEALYIIGVGDNVELLQEITDEATKHDLMERKEAAVRTPNFIQSILKAQQKKNDSSAIPSFTSQLQTELSKLKKNRSKMMDEVDKREDTHV